MNTDSQTKPKRFQQYRNWVSLSGVVVAVSSFFAFLLLFTIDILAHHGNPYMGILAYMVAPGFTALGVFLIALGAWIHRRHVRRSQAGVVPRSFTIDLSRPRDKKALVGFIAGTVVFLLATALGSYNTYHYTESIHFCGQTCHTPMKPEYTAYLNSPHARVACTECHVGPGATSYVKSKINGVHQLICTFSDDFHRPIKTPIKNLRPAQETCEQCHWPQKFIGNLDRNYAHFLADETNTPFTVRLLLKVGGADPAHGPTGGIHWHMNVDNKVEYITTDEQRQVIPWVRTTSRDGKVTEYRDPKFKDDCAKHVIRTMDCMDCHNRPAHDYRSPNDAVDLAMSLNKIDPALPWAKSNAVASLIQTYSTEDEALQKISLTLRSKYPSYPKVDSLVSEVQNIYSHNFFPEMKADWRAYPNNIGHKNWAGCFRCHDGLHQSEDGKKKIEGTDCNACHVIVAQGSGAELLKLSSKGHDFFHLDGEMHDFSCNNCHNGAFTR
jgi:nitrate/TMAO reductase-like tetraheme cytochrome c subunit